jgi:hypothetical protein
MLNAVAISLEQFHLIGSVIRVSRPAHHSKQDLERIPARGKRGVQRHGAHEGVDGGRRRPQRHMAMAAFLEQPAVFGVVPFQLVECRQRVRDAVQVALTDRNHVEKIAIRRP